MASMITTEFGAEFQKLLNQEKAIPYNELLMNLLTCLDQHGFLDEREMCATKMLVQHKNRNCLMLSAHNVHANAATVHKVGQIEANSKMQCALSWQLKVISGRSTSKKIKHLLLVLKASWHL